MQAKNQEMVNHKDIELAMIVIIKVAYSQGKNKRSEEHTSELQSPCNLVCRLLLEKKKSHSSTTCRMTLLYSTERYVLSASPSPTMIAPDAPSHPITSCSTSRTTVTSSLDQTVYE